MGRVKQTARKSTGASSSVQRTIPPRVDPVRSQMRNLLQTKRKSATPSMKRDSSVGSSGSSVGGLGKGRKIFPKGKNIDNNRDRVKRPPRSTEPSFACLKEIKRIIGGNNQIARAAFHRLVRQVTTTISSEGGKQKNDESGYKYQAAALEALQEATETFLVRLFEDGYLCTLHAKRVTLFVSDLKLVHRLQRVPTVSELAV